MNPGAALPAHGGASEEALILSHSSHEGGQRILRLSAAHSAAQALPGNFVRLSHTGHAGAALPLSIMRADREGGWIELLYKVVGRGTTALAERQVGERIQVQGPLGQPFVPHPERPRVLGLGGGVGVPPMVFLADHLRTRSDAQWQPLVLMGSELAFPFRARPSRILVNGMPDEAIACMPLLDEWQVPSRLASRSGHPGCFDGHVTELARHWLDKLDTAARDEVELFACGPAPMMAAAAELASEFGLPLQMPQQSA